ncbi:MAG: hypothetical protein DWQ06_10410 [Calditrichaeota bacterium]|nr:MAG: hypothetical protein DWQ06_10410 [Calditrichota bacterium]
MRRSVLILILITLVTLTVQNSFAQANSHNEFELTLGESKNVNIEFSVPNLKRGLQQVELLILSRNGNLVRSLFSGFLPSGNYSIKWDSKNSDNKSVNENEKFIVQVNTEKPQFTEKLYSLK